MPEPSKGVGPKDIENQLAGQAGRKNYLLAVVAATIVIAIVIWQVAKPSKQPAAWDCAQHYDQCQDQDGYYMVR